MRLPVKLAVLLIVLGFLVILMCSLYLGFVVGYSVGVNDVLRFYRTKLCLPT